MAGKIKWGILGYANIARDELIPAILQSKNSEFYALASRAPGKLESCRKSFNFEKGYVGYDALLNDPEVQAVYIPLPNSLHREWTIKAARCGKHVLCEKPVALNAAECMEMIEACESNHVLLMEAFMYRYSDRVRQLKTLLDSGMTGEIRHISASFRFLLDWDNDVRMAPELGGGSLYDVGCYPVNFIGMITGRLPSAVQAQVVMQNGVDYSFSALLEYENGLICNVNSGFDACEQMEVQIAGTLGNLSTPDLFWGNAGSMAVKTKAGRQEIAVAESSPYRLEVEDFADAILNGRKPLLSLEETLLNMKVIDRLMALIR